MRKIDLIALDLDGTFLDPAGEISPASLEAVRTARAAGVKVVLSTGRSGAEAAHFSKLAGCDNLAVCLGGAALCDARTGSHLRRWDLPEETGRRALELCLGRDIELMIFAGEEILLDPFSRRSLQRTYPFSVFHRRAVDVPDPLAHLAERGLPLTKLHGDQKPGGYPLEELAALPAHRLQRPRLRAGPCRGEQGPYPGPPRPDVGHPPGALRRRGGQRQRPGDAPGGGLSHRHGERRPPGAGGRRPHCGGQQP